MSTCYLESKEFSEKKIVIIGAGVSGLGCAAHLKELGFNNVLILEGRNRVGGRTHTVYEGSYYIEMGAQWIHGKKENVIFDLASSNGLVDETAPNYLESLFKFDTDEELIIEGVINHLEEKLADIPPDCDDISLSEFLNNAFKNYSLNCEESKLGIMKAAYDYYCKLQCELNGCQDLSCVNVCLLNQYKECEGLKTVELKHGYRSVTDLVLEKIPHNWIQLNKTVKKIDWSGLKGEDCSNCSKHLKIAVYCEDKSIYYSDHVIITVPLGFLKRHLGCFFVPNLSEDKVMAVQKIGFGTVNKIFLEFEDPFWESSKVFNIFWNDELEEVFQSYFHESSKDSKYWIKDISRFSYMPSHPKILIGWITGYGAIVMESLSEEEISCCCMKILETVIGLSLPQPSKIICSKWGSDVFTYGSYSFLSMESDRDSHLQIAEPEYSSIPCSKHPVLQFAGEATHSCYYSTVHGAYETGIREAKRLFEHYRNSCEVLCMSGSDNPNLAIENEYGQVKTIIIGAGIAGLAVAQSLSKRGINQFSVLEAQEKAGGRILSFNLNNHFIELGAQWLHGAENELYDYSLAHNLLADPLDEPSFEAKGNFCTSNGLVLNDTLVKEMIEVFFNFRATLSNTSNNEFVSAYSFFCSKFESYNSQFEDSLYPIRKGLFQWFLKYEVIDNACDHLDDVALECYSEWCDVPEDTYCINYEHGMQSLIESLSCHIPKENIFFNSPVKQIRYQREFSHFTYSNRINNPLLYDNKNYFPAVVELEDGLQFGADIVILTASLGFIKENINTLFYPPISKSKAKAFCDIGYGTINKIYMLYNKPFWTAGDVGFQLVWTYTDEDLKQLLKKNPWISGISGFDIVRKQQNVLLGWIGGMEARLIEKCTIESISEACTKLLRKFLNRDDIPYPTQVIRTKWYENKYTKGAYSYRSTKFSESSCFEELQSPVCLDFIEKNGKKVKWPVLMFAGEALDKTSFSTIHGAFQSGLKAADNVIEFSSRLKNIYQVSSSVKNHII